MVFMQRQSSIWNVLLTALGQDYILLRDRITFKFDCQYSSTRSGSLVTDERDRNCNVLIMTRQVT